MPLILIALLSILFLGLVWLVYHLVWGTPPDINLAVERLGLQMVWHDPETLSTLGLLDNSLLDFHSNRLTDVSPRAEARRQQLDRDGLALIRRYQPERLTGEKQMTYDLMRWYFEQNLLGHRFDYHWVTNPVFMGPYPVNHVYGEQINLINFLTTYHRIEGKRSVLRYLERLDWVGWKLSGLQESVQARANSGVIPPRFVLERSLNQIREFINNPIDTNPLYTRFMEQLTASGHFDQSAQSLWGEKVHKSIELQVLPAYRDLESLLVNLVEKAPVDDGVWQFPDGLAYYDYLLSVHTTTSRNADQIHQLGLQEVARLTDMIRRVLETLGLPADDPGGQLNAMMRDPQYLYAGPDRRQQIIKDYQAILDEVNQHLTDFFNDGALDAIVVERLPEFKEPDSPIAYAEPPALDGSRPGRVWINLRDPDNIYKWGMRTLAYHEGIPGHVYQMTRARKIRGLPTFRRTYFFNAYVEGWALYAERLAWELKLGDAVSNLGRLQALLWRAARLVVDTGIHSRQWNRAEAIDYLVRTTGMPRRDMVTEVERYIVSPGQACAYYIGFTNLLSFRRKAEAAVGANFDLKEFHDVVLNHGSLPLSLLEAVIDSYVDDKAGLIPAQAK